MKKQAHIPTLLQRLALSSDWPQSERLRYAGTAVAPLIVQQAETRLRFAQKISFGD
jgi:hypothetical protein